MHDMQVRQMNKFIVLGFVALLNSACETTRSDSNELVQLDTANPKDMEFQSKLAKAVSPFGQLVEVHVSRNELNLYRTGQKPTITNYKYLMKPIPGTSLEDLSSIK